MTDHLKQERAMEDIRREYLRHQYTPLTNVLEFVPPLSNRTLEILDNVEALLTDKNTRFLAEEILQEAIYEIAQKSSI